MTLPLAVPLTSRAPDAWRRSLLALALLLAAIGTMYFDSFRAMVQIWDRSETFAHAFVVPPIALWLIWRQRAQLALHRPAPRAALLLPMAAVAALWLLGQLVVVNSVTQLAATAMLVLAVPALLGARVAGAILFPLCYLFFAVPIGEFMIPPLMQATADFTVLALRLSGIPVYREGLQFVIPSGNWSVVEACSGVRYLMASFMVGSLFAYLNYRSWRRRLLFGIVSLLVPVVANWLRAYMIVMLGHLSNNKIATGADHLLYGWVFFGVVITIVFMIGARWAEAPAEPRAPKVSPAEEGSATVAQLGLIGFGAVLVLSVPLLLMQRIEAAEATQLPHLSLSPELAAGWRQVGGPEAQWKPVYQNPSAEAAAQYASQAGQKVGIYLAYYRQQDEARKLVSSTNVLVSSKDKLWNAIEAKDKVISLPSRSLAVHEARVLPSTGSGTPDRAGLLVWQLYWINGSLTASDHEAKLLGAWHRLMGRGDESAAIVLYTADTPSQPGRAALESFVRENLSMIEAGLAATSRAH